MKLTRRVLHDENDYWRVRNFLRQVFLLNNRLEHSWHVARLDHWRWHFIQTCQLTAPFEQVAVAWETEKGEIAAVLHPCGDGEIRLHIHPHFRTQKLEDEVFAYADEHYSEETENGQRIIYAPVFVDDVLRQGVLTRRGYTQHPGWNHHYWRDLTDALPVSSVPDGYTIRAMGDESEYPTRSWCSWRAFHADEPDSKYDGDFSWYRNMQSTPLYRRDLDIVAATPVGEIAAFCTISYDDYTRSAVTVLVGTAAEHWRRGLGKAVMLEGMRRLQRLGCTRVFSTAADEPADALYHSVMTDMKATDTWVKEWTK
jgi:mycothiol synthase